MISLVLAAVVSVMDVPPVVEWNAEGIIGCNRQHAAAGECKVLQRSKDGTWLTVWHPKNGRCPHGYYGVINTVNQTGRFLSSMGELCGDGELVKIQLVYHAMYHKTMLLQYYAPDWYVATELK